MQIKFTDIIWSVYNEIPAGALTQVQIVDGVEPPDGEGLDVEPVHVGAPHQPQLHQQHVHCVV